LEENDPSLVELNLNGNAVCSAKHGVAIAKALIKNTHLKQLMLDSTCQDTEAAIEVKLIIPSFSIFYNNNNPFNYLACKCFENQ